MLSTCGHGTSTYFSSTERAFSMLSNSSKSTQERAFGRIIGRPSGRKIGLVRQVGVAKGVVLMEVTANTQQILSIVINLNRDLPTELRTETYNWSLPLPLTLFARKISKINTRRDRSRGLQGSH